MGYSVAEKKTYSTRRWRRNRKVLRQPRIRCGLCTKIVERVINRRGKLVMPRHDSVTGRVVDMDSPACVGSRQPNKAEIVTIDIHP